MKELEFKEKARRHLFNCDLRAFPVVFEMYVRAFDLGIVEGAGLEEAMGQIISIIRTSPDASTAYDLVCHYLDTLDW